MVTDYPNIHLVTSGDEIYTKSLMRPTLQINKLKHRLKKFAKKLQNPISSDTIINYKYSSWEQLSPTLQMGMINVPFLFKCDFETIFVFIFEYVYN